MKYIDISSTVDKNMPHWPTSSRPVIKRLFSLAKGSKSNVSWIGMGIHTGTHIDAPEHFIRNGNTIDKIKIKSLIGKCYVCNTKNRGVIDVSYLNSIKVPQGVKKILFHTKNSSFWKDSKFHKDFVALTPQAARWIVKKGINLVGIDYLSIERFGEKGNRTHKILLKKKVIIVEGLNLSHVKDGVYKLIVLPIKIKGCEGAPARAILEAL